MRNLLISVFFILALGIIFVSGYLTADRAPQQVTTNVTVVVETNKLVVYSPRREPRTPVRDELEEMASRQPVAAETNRPATETNTTSVAVDKRPTVEKVVEEILAPTKETGPLILNYPKPMFVGTPVPIVARNLERPGKRGGTVTVRSGTRLLSRGKPVTSSDPNPLLGDLAQITDGDKSAEEGSYVEFAGGLQWVQIDLKEIRQLQAIAVWHYHLQARAYRDVIILISNDPEFKKGVLPVTRDIYTAAYFKTDPKLDFGAMLFNNDDDGSAQWSKGADEMYVDDNKGLVVSAWGIPARYIRLYSNGNTSNGMNHYIEVEVYGL